MMGPTNCCRSHRHGGCRTAVMLLLWLLAPTVATRANTLLLSGEHLVLVVIAVLGAYLMATLAIGPVNGSIAALLRQKQMTNRAHLKRPGRGVPPPRSGPHPPVVMLNKCVVSAVEHLQAPWVYVYDNSVRAWGMS